eukprot:s125_g37.t1
MASYDLCTWMRRHLFIITCMTSYLTCYMDGASLVYHNHTYAHIQWSLLQQSTIYWAQVYNVPSRHNRAAMVKLEAQL